MSLSADGVGLVGGLRAQGRTWRVRNSSFGLPGDLVFVDTQGTADPQWSGLGTRFVLLYEEGRNV